MLSESVWQIFAQLGREEALRNSGQPLVVYLLSGWVWVDGVWVVRDTLIASVLHYLEH